MANSYLTFNETATPANQTKFTYSAWIKRSKLSADQTIFYNYKDSSNYGYMYFRSGDDLRYFDRVAGGDTAIFATTRKFRDTSAWYHLVLQVDTTQGTNTNRLKFYVNGVQETLAETTYPNQDQALSLPREGVRTIGASNGGSNLFEGYQSHVAFVDSTSPAYTTFGETDSTSGIWKFKSPSGVTFVNNAIVAPTSFGSTDSTSGIWKFKSPSGITWGTNGVHLKFENSGAMGTDSSGNSNTFTVNGNLKQALDTPSNVYATMNPLSQKDPTVVYGNGNTKTFYNQTSTFAVYSTLAASSGKYYAECKIDAVGAASSVGVISVDTANLRQNSQDFIGEQTDSIGYLQNGEIKKANSNQQTGLTSFSNGTIVGIAMDLDNNTVQFYINGASTGNSVSLTADKFYYFGDAGHSDAGHLWNFGNGYFGTTAITSAGSNGNGSLFEYDVPSGYYALNTKNINTYG